MDIKTQKSQQTQRLPASEIADYSELGLVDIAHFIRENWKTFFISICAGGLLSIIFLILYPKQYEAVSQMQVAQLVTNKNNNGEASIINVENPAILMNRLKSPLTYDENTLRVCGFSNNASAMAMVVTSNIPKGATNTLEIKFKSKTKDAAIECVAQLFLLIQSQEIKLTQPYIEEMSQRIDEINTRIKLNQEILEKSAQLPLGSWSYFFNLDEIRRLYAERDNLKNVITLTHVYKAKLLIPPYSMDRPVSPNFYKVIFIGLSTGFIFSLFFIFLRKRTGVS
jgi:hypothetical protein